MKTLELVQGSKEWLAARLEYFTASEAPAVMGASKHISRTQLLDHKKGWTTEVDEFTQKLFDKGHKSEQDALPIVEAIIDDELYPVVGFKEGTKFLASFDGLTMMEDVAYEHKLFSKVLAENVMNHVVEPHYYWQLEHQLLVSDAEKVIFVTSDGTEKNMQHLFYISDPERRSALIAAWAQFEIDLKTHEPQAKTEKVVAEEVTSLPAISYKMDGLALTSNLNTYKESALALVEKSKSIIETDQDFANAESRQKIFAKAESDIKELADRVLSEVADIDKFTKDLKFISEQIRQARLSENKQIKTRKETIRAEIAQKAGSELNQFVSKLMNELNLQFPFDNAAITNAMKGKKTIDSLQDAADTTVASIKITINENASLARANLAIMKELAQDYRFLFSDWKEIIFKDSEDFTAVIKTRITEHKEAEQKRLDAEREKIRAEEQARAEREAQAKIQAEKDAQAKRDADKEVTPNVKRYLNQVEKNALLEFKAQTIGGNQSEFYIELGRAVDSYIRKNSKAAA